MNKKAKMEPCFYSEYFHCDHCDICEDGCYVEPKMRNEKDFVCNKGYVMPNPGCKEFKRHIREITFDPINNQTIIRDHITENDKTTITETIY